MFFIISKIFAWIASPVTYIIIFVALAVWTKKKWLKRTAWVLPIGVTLLCSNKWVYNETMRAMSAPYITEPVKTYQYGVVLGGFADFDLQRNRVEFYEGADRLIDAVTLYQKGIIKKVVVTGDGSHMNLHTHKADPEVLLSLLESWSVKRADIILENRARNTKQNAAYTLELIGDSLLTQPVLLITSAYHMKRSLRVFERLGIHPDPYGTDVIMDPQYEWIDVLPDFQYLGKWQTILHEWIGLVVYEITG
ncbi:MAG: YdcF family protein [Prolixibacteraceae bacterium]